MTTAFQISFFVLAGTIVLTFYFQKALMQLLGMNYNSESQNTKYSKWARRIIIVEVIVMAILFLMI